MYADKYQLKSEEKFTRFEFISEGPKGAIRKLVEFQHTTDDLIISDNGNTEKILATVVAAVYAFLDNYPTAYVYAQGSTKPRTRLYRMGINRFYKDMQRDFHLYGRIGEDFWDFEQGVEYEGFLAQRKFS